MQLKITTPGSQAVGTVTVLYMGCLREAGHYLIDNEQFSSRAGRRNGVNERLEYSLDGAFCPPERFGLFKYMRSHVPPWHIFSWWDNTGDNRPGSHSTFLIKHSDFTATISDADAFALFREAFPSVMGRMPEITKCPESLS